MTKKIRRKPGPPPHADGPYVIVALNVREKMKRDIEEAAAYAGTSVSAFMRDVAKQALKRKRR